MRVYRGDIDVRAIIDAGLAVRALERADSERVSSSDFVVSIGQGYDDWSAEFIDTILDFIERDRRVARRFRTWRKARSRHRASRVARMPYYMEHFQRDPDVVNGQWVIKGTRVTLRTILASLADGDSEDDIRRNFPAVTNDNIRAVIAFAAAAAADDLPLSELPRL